MLLLSASLLALAGCGAGGFSQESPGADAFILNSSVNPIREPSEGQTS